tara:strand:+ start:2794 stop:3966 length:1173 start_codon:yes stop_codon:yes gene_type:complete
MKNNIIKMYFLKAILWFMVSMPIIVIFFTDEHNLSISQVMLLQGIYSITIAFFEIPSGYIADILGRKKSIIFGTVFSFIGFIFFSFFSGFVFFAIAQIFVGIGGSLISGSDVALIYDTLIEINQTESYTKIEGKNYAIGNFSEATAGILGGILAVTSLYLPIYVQTVIIFFSIPVAFSLIEPSINLNEKSQNSLYDIKNVFISTLIDNTRLKWLIILSSFVGVATLSIAWFIQPYFQLIGIHLSLFGFLWALLNFLAGISSYNAYRFINFYRTKYFYYIISILIFSCIFFMGLNISYFGIFFIIIIYIIRGILTPFLKDEINKIIESKRRATILSIRSFLIRITFAISAPLIAYCGEIYSFSFSLYLLAIFVGFFLFVSSYKIYKLNTNV